MKLIDLLYYFDWLFTSRITAEILIFIIHLKPKENLSAISVEFFFQNHEQLVEVVSDDEVQFGLVL